MWVRVLRYFVQRGSTLRRPLPQHVSTQRYRHPGSDEHLVPQ